MRPTMLCKDETFPIQNCPTIDTYYSSQYSSIILRNRESVFISLHYGLWNTVKFHIGASDKISDWRFR